MSSSDNTDKICCEYALDQSERYQHVFRACPAMVVASCLEDGTILDISDMFLDRIGLHRNDVLGKRSLDIGIITDTERQRLIRLVHEQGRVSGEPLEMYSDDGQVFYALASAQVVVFDAIPVLLCVFEDVSRSKQDKERLYTLMQAVEQSPAALIITDANGVLTYANRAYTEITGFSAKEVRGVPLPFFASTDYTSDFKNDIRLSLKDKGVWRGEALSRRKDGTLFWERATLAPVMDTKGRVTHFVGVREDITERKEADRHVRESETLFRTIFEDFNAGILMVEPGSLTIIDANHAAENLCGYSRSELVGKSCRELFDSDSPCFVAREKIANQESALHRKDNQIRTVLRTSLPIQKGGKEILVEILIDISERKALERQLAIAQKLESIGQLAAGIAHELNTPIQYVGDSVRFLHEVYEEQNLLLEAWEQVRVSFSEAGIEHPEVAQALANVATVYAEGDFDFLRTESPKAIRQSLDGLERMTHIVLAMKRFAHPGDDSEVKEADINAAIQDTIVVSRNEWKYVAEVETELASDLPLVRCMPANFNQVLLNLLVNAAQAIADVVDESGKKGRIFIATQFGDEEVIITIRDTGGGIPESYLNRIYDPFFTTKPVGKGTGQGLAIAHDIVVTKHGGTIDVDSQVGKGTCFTIRLPVGNDSCFWGESA